MRVGESGGRGGHFFTWATDAVATWRPYLCVYLLIMLVFKQDCPTLSPLISARVSPVSRRRPALSDGRGKFGRFRNEFVNSVALGS